MMMMGDKKKAVAAILGPHADNVGAKGKEDGPSSLHIAAEEALDAVHAKDPAAFLDALRAIFEELDSEPHVEGDHV